MLLRKILLFLLLGPFVGALTIISWFTFWPLVALLEKMGWGEVYWPGIWHDSTANWRRFLTSVKGAG